MAGFVNIGGSERSLDKGIELQTPFGSVTVPMMVVSGFEGGAPKGALMDLWIQCWPETLPNPLMVMAVFFALAHALTDQRIAEALAEACRPN